MKKRAKTRIICTLGPASSTPVILRKMMIAGMDVVRLNFSHGSSRHRLERIKIIRDLNHRYRRAVKILCDLEGFRIRVGELNHPVFLRKKDRVWLKQENRAGTGYKIPFDFSGELKTIKNGTCIFIDDGNIRLLVTGRRGNSLMCEVIVGGSLKSRKGINIPQAKLKFKGLTRKDIQDIGFCIETQVDFIAQSFVRNKEDVLMVKDLLKKSRKEIKVIAKIENREGIKNIDEIIEAGDGIMVARGDMGISIPIYEVPIVQKQIIKKCNRAGKMVITATQMLESMSENILPTRAEVTDVANAVLDGTDYVMLSGETAVGKYPSETVKMMDKIIKFTEYHK